MLRTICLVSCLASLCVASSYGYYKKQEEKKCYQCTYSPPRTIIKTIYKIETVKLEVPVTEVHCWYKFTVDGEAEDVDGNPEALCTNHEKKCETNTSYKMEEMTKKVPEEVKEVTSAGGFDACKGPIDEHTALSMGVDSWDCDSNCYVRKNDNEMITRGCYAGENEVDPTLLGCHEQAGQMYCFCDGDRCNSE